MVAQETADGERMLLIVAVAFPEDRAAVEAARKVNPGYELRIAAASRSAVLSLSEVNGLRSEIARLFGVDQCEVERNVKEKKIRVLSEIPVSPELRSYCEQFLGLTFLDSSGFSRGGPLIERIARILLPTHADLLLGEYRAAVRQSPVAATEGLEKTSWPLTMDIANRFLAADALQQMRFQPAVLEGLFKQQCVLETGRDRQSRTIGGQLCLYLVEENNSGFALPAFEAKISDSRDGVAGARADIIAAAIGLFCVAGEKDLEENERRYPTSVLISAGRDYWNYLETLHAEIPFLQQSVQAENAHWRRMRIDAVSAKQKRELGDLLDRILNDCLIGARPVARWRTHFLVALQGNVRALAMQLQDSGTSPGGVKWKLGEPQTSGNATSDEQSYFLPELQHRLFGKEPSGSALVTYEAELNDLNAKMTLEHGNYQDPIELTVHAARLHFFGGKTILFEWVLGESDKHPLDDALRTPQVQGFRELWRDYLWRFGRQADQEAPTGACGGASMARIVDANAELRLTRHTYPRHSVNRMGEEKPHSHTLSIGMGSGEVRTSPAGQTTPPHAAGKVGQELDPLVREPLKALLGEADAFRSLRQCSDDRARVISSVVLEGEPPSSVGDRNSGTTAMRDILGRLVSVDPFGIGPSYEAGFAARELEHSAHARFHADTGGIHVTDHSMVFLGYRHDRQNFVERRQASAAGEEVSASSSADIGRRSFDERFVHNDHMCGIYRRMFLVFMFQEAQLRQLALRMTKLEGALAQAGPGNDHSGNLQEIRDLRSLLARAGREVLHPNLSSQVQGRELTSLMTRQFALNEEWRALHEKLETMQVCLDEEAERHEKKLEADRQWLRDLVMWVGIPYLVLDVMFNLLPASGRLPTLSFMSLPWFGLGRLADAHLPASMSGASWQAAFLLVIAAWSGAVISIALAVAATLRGTGGGRWLWPAFLIAALVLGLGFAASWLS